MKKQLLAFCLLLSGSLLAIDNNVELIGNGDFSTNITPAQNVSGTSTAGVWFVGDNTLGAWNTAPGFVADAATGAFVSANGTLATNVFDNFLGQLTTETGVNSGRYHFSISAKGDQPFYIKISSAAVLGTELGFVLRNPSSAAIEKQATADYAGYTLKIMPTGTATTYTADLDLTNATPSAIRVLVVFPKAGSVTVDDISLKRTKDIPTVFYVRPAVNTSAWSNFPADQVISTDLLFLDGTYTYYLAQGTYTTAGVSVSTGKVYGGFSGNEIAIVLNDRATNDKDGNGIVEPWEFTNEAIITTNNETYKFTAAGTASGSRLLVISGTGGEVNGVTLTDFYYTTYWGAISIGKAATTPVVGDNTADKAGILRLCTVKRIKTNTGCGAIMLTNKYSLVDRCLIESNVTTAVNTGGTVYMNLCGGKVTGSVIRNNAAVGTGGRGAGVYATSLASANMDAIIENCVVYNNYALANGAAIRADAQGSKRGIEIINTTIVNNQTATTAGTGIGSVELISGGSIVNSLIVGDPSSELRANTTNNYIINTAYGEYATGASTLYGSNNISGKVVADFNFATPTLFAGVMIPDYTTPYDAAKYNAIRQANFKITSSASVAATAVSTKSYPASYLIGGSGASVTLSTYSIPTTDLMGVERPISTNGHLDLGAYQFSGLTTGVNGNIADSGVKIYSLNNGVNISGAKGKLVTVFSLSGQLIKSELINTDNSVLKINKGLYIVKIGSQVNKVSVK